MLQHGGVVTREFCKPCVAGIQVIITTLQGDQLVEVNGTTGVVRILDMQQAMPLFTLCIFMV